SKAIAPLIGALDHKDPKTRYSAVTALTYIRDIQAIVPLSFALLDNDADVRLAAVVAFENFGPEGRIALPTLFLMLRDIPAKELHDDLGCNIRGALAEIGQPAIPPIVYELRRNDASRELKQLLLGALSNLAQIKGGAELRPALPYLVEMVRASKDIDVKN